MLHNIQNLKQELEKISEWLKKEFAQIHTGKATPVILDSINIESYGARTPIKNVASITVEDAKTLRVAPWDKNQIKEIEKAISSADLGLSVVSDADGVRAIFPMLTTETRTKLVKALKEKLEDARISVRKVRGDEMGKIEDLSEDDKKRAKDEIQKFVDEANKSLEEIFNKKEKDLMN